MPVRRGSLDVASGDDAHPDDVLVLDADLLEGLVIARRELDAVQGPHPLRRRVEVRVSSNRVSEQP